MIEIFFRSEGRISVSQSESVFAELQKSDVVWIDLLSPTGEEKRATESFLGTTIQSRAQAEEIRHSRPSGRAESVSRAAVQALNASVRSCP